MSVDSKLEISFGGFLSWVMFVRYFSKQGCWGYIHSNLLDGILTKNPTLFPVQTYGLFICDTIHLVEVSHIDKSCILELETYLVENSRSPSYPFFRQWFMIGTIIPSYFYLIFLGFYLFVVVLFFKQPKRSMQLGNIDLPF